MLDVSRCLKTDIPLAKYTTLGVGGTAAFFAEPEDLKELRAVLEFAEAEGLNLFVLGGGADTLFADSRFEGVVVKLRGFKGIRIKGNRLEVDAGVALPRLVKVACEENLSGLEFLAGVPGEMGGAIAKNAGAFGTEMKDILVKASILSWEGYTLELTSEELGMSYRDSKLQEIGVVVRAVIELSPGERDKIEEKMNQNLEHRKKTQPLGAKTAGCIFKNPPNLKAGYLLEKAGLKGARIGDAMFSPVHANFIVNEGQATADDVLSLIQMAKERVKEQFGVDLEEEIVILRQGG